MIYLRQSTASQEVQIGRFVDDTDFKTAETGLTIANTDVKLHKHGGTSQVSKNSGGATHIANGWYYIVLDATDTDTIGNLTITVDVAGALSVMARCVVLDEAVYDVLFGTTAPSTHTAAAVQSLVTGGAYSVQSSSCVLGDARAANLDAAVTTRLAPTTAGRTLDVTATGAAGIDWGNVENQDASVNLENTTVFELGSQPTVTIGSGGITALSFATGAITAAALAADCITDAKVAADVTVASVTGSVGSVTGNVGGNVTGSVGSISGVTFPTNFASLGINASGHVSRVVLTDTVTTYTGNTPQTGDSFARIGAAGAGLTSLAPAATALSTAQWSNTRAGYLDNLSGGAVALASGVTLADGVTHGGATAKLRLGTTDGTTPALRVDTSGGVAAVRLTNTGEDNSAAVVQVTKTQSAEGYTLEVSGGEVQIYAPTISGSLSGSVGSALALAANSVTAAALAADAGTEIGTAVWATAARTLTAGTNIVLAKGTGVTGFTDLSAADVRTAVGLASANLDTQLGAIDDYLDTEVAAIKAKTDLIPAAPAGVGDIPTAAAIASAVWAFVAEGAYTAVQLLRGIFAFTTGKASGGGTATIRFRDAGDTKDRIVATVDADGNRTARTLDLT